MKRRRFVSRFLLGVLLLGASGSLGHLLLWAQEGALGGSVEEEVVEQREKASELAPKPKEPVVIYDEGGTTPEDPKKRNWGNMNWFALYLAVAGPATYFVFRGVSR